MRRSLRSLLTKSSVAAVISLSVVASASGASAAGARMSSRVSSRSAVVQGTVVSNDFARHTLVVALNSGVIRTLRFGSARHVVMGAKISSSASILGDGTFRARTLHVIARSRSVRLRATVVGTHGKRLVLSGGGSVFSVNRPPMSPHSTGSNPSIGEVVNVTADVQNGSISETAIQSVGAANMIDLEGVLNSLSSTSLTINVNEGAVTTVAIPTTITLPSTIAVGDQVELMVAYANQAFTLVTIVDDHAAANNTSTGVTPSSADQTSNVEIEGIVVATDATSLTIQPGDSAASLVVSVPTTLAMSPVAVGDRVHAVADLVAGILTLVSLNVQTPEGDQGQSMTTEAEGQVVSVSSTTLVVQPNDQGTPVSFVVPATLDVSSIVVGDRVHASGNLSGGVLSLTDFRVQGTDGAPNNPSNGPSNAKVEGVVTAVSPTNLTVTPHGNATAITITVPATIDVSTVAVGSHLTATTAIVNGTLTLVTFEID